MSLAYTFILPHPPIILNEIGRGEELKIIDTINAYKKVAKIIAQIEPDTIIVTSPHSSYYTNYFHIAGGAKGTGDFGNFGAGQVSMDIDYDQELIGDIIDESLKDNIPATTQDGGFDTLDHGTMVPLYFINKEYKDYKLVRVSLSGHSKMTHYNFGEAIRRAVDDSGKKVVFVASGDLSHVLKEDGPYGFVKEGPKFDKIVIDALKVGDFKTLIDLDDDFCDKAAECGLRSFVIMAGAIGDSEVRPELLSYEGPFGVGYGVVSFELTDSIDPYVKLARDSLEYFLNDYEYMKMPEDLPKEMYENRAGVFVSLKKDGELRGCIGTIEGITGSIAEEIIRNAVSAGVSDPRFYPVERKELKDLSISVDVLGKAFFVDDRSILDARRYGVIVSLGGRRGLLLPNLEGVDTPGEQIRIALQKAGIGADEDYELEAFEVVRHK